MEKEKLGLFGFQTKIKKGAEDKKTRRSRNANYYFDSLQKLYHLLLGGRKQHFTQKSFLGRAVWFSSSML
jgi:hypothetical protein